MSGCLHCRVAVPPRAARHQWGGRNEDTQALHFHRSCAPTEAERFREWEGPLPAWPMRRLVGAVGALSLSPGYHENLLDSKVTPREVNAQW